MPCPLDVPAIENYGFLNSTSDCGTLLHKVLCKFHFERVCLSSCTWHMSPGAQAAPSASPSDIPVSPSLFPGHPWMPHSFLPLHMLDLKPTSYTFLARQFLPFFQDSTKPCPGGSSLLHAALHRSSLIPPFWGWPHAPLYAPKVSTRSCSALCARWLVQDLEYSRLFKMLKWLK